MIRIVTAEEFSLRREERDVHEKEREAVREVIEQVRLRGDEAVCAYTERFDGIALRDLRVPAEQYEAAYQQVSPLFLEALREAIRNIRTYHQGQLRTSTLTPMEEGVLLGQIIRPLRRVGVYVPGGTAAYPSSVLMNVIPAQVAGVPEIVLVTPPDREGNISPGVLVAIQELGIREVYRVGGAQAIAALAYGTETIRPVNKIVGPGNIYVALAKQMVFGQVGIESVAGPSDVLVIADDTADPQYVAADLLSQAEHGEWSQAILATPSRPLAEAVAEEIERQLASLPRRSIAEKAIREMSAIVVTKDLEEAIAVANRVAPEHLELLVEHAEEYVAQVENAGAIFLGPYSTEPVGDYYCGTNHVLPTEGTARFSSPLNVDDFLKKQSLIRYSRRALLKNGHKIIAMAQVEGLEAHARAIQLRLEKEGEGK